MKLVLFNGPPSCDKDTAALAAFRRHATEGTHFRVFDRMSMPIKRAFAATMSLNIDAFGNVEPWESRKEETIPLFGISYRQWQIDFSEHFMKPLYGEDIFGKLMISRLKKQHKDSLVLIPDCGFDIEYQTLVSSFGIENVLVIKIYREGCNFKNDSRTYLSVGHHFPSGLQDDIEGYNVMYLTNNGTKGAFELKVIKTIEGWLNRVGTSL